ncbi:hypothetical protein F5B22DRAFT_87701 [Xylaria bambusicola]|uniref:uncharacterized protein n=1 Tax=Xylaria bambusicola TaxID=326684 RepID=UPI00200795FD|nr:uncharacterized protein F5B22DRAFT_87701 [Xylaria bambusicola]KAI0518009.1 hypothetical protein F5B22DRAFT_87701 [Xylaria bambusicola]
MSNTASRDKGKGKAIQSPDYADPYYKSLHPLSAWIIITASEEDASLSERICLPRRFCLSRGKPTSPLVQTAFGSLRTASCVLQRGWKLFMISAGAETVSSSIDGSRDHGVWDEQVSRKPQYVIKECVKLGEVIYQATHNFVIVEVADKFRVCQDAGCTECTKPVNDSGFVSNKGPGDSETVRIWTLGEPVAQELNPKVKISVDLPYRPSNKDFRSFSAYTVHEGAAKGLFKRTKVMIPWIDWGGLVSQDGQFIGIVNNTRGAKDTIMVEVLVFDKKLWATLDGALKEHMFPGLIAGPSVTETDPFIVTSLFRHLEYRY